MISAIVLTKNEEKNILECLAYLHFCDEVIVIDDNSTDNTVELAKKNGAIVFQRPLSNDFSQQRNLGLSKASGEWVLFIDADERVTPTLVKEIKAQIANTQAQGFYIKRRDFMWGRELKHGDAGNIVLLRLAKKNAGHWQGSVHETWQIKGNTGVLTQVIYHYPHPSLGEFLTDINYYTTVRANELYKQKKRAGFWSVFFYPKAKFVQVYILKFGVLDGLVGLVHAILMSFHSFLVRAKLWVLWQEKK
jgi:glycosyltransferase involved in cell wall biosynthesis